MHQDTKHFCNVLTMSKSVYYNIFKLDIFTGLIVTNKNKLNGLLFLAKTFISCNRKIIIWWEKNTFLGLDWCPYLRKAEIETEFTDCNFTMWFICPQFFLCKMPRSKQHFTWATLYTTSFKYNTLFISSTWSCKFLFVSNVSIKTTSSPQI